MWTLYDNRDSGNGYKVRRVLIQLELPHQLVEVDTDAGQTRTPAFLSKNPNGRIPLLELAPGEYLAESNAIMFYVAEGSALIPADRLGRARMLQWMFFEQYSHEPYVATPRRTARTRRRSISRPTPRFARGSTASQRNRATYRCRASLADQVADHA
jgi:glutathione S-transferase